jgi:hypothetical protein
MKHMYIQKNIPIIHCNEPYNYTCCRLFAMKRKRMAKALVALENGMKTSGNHSADSLIKFYLTWLSTKDQPEAMYVVL